MQTFGLKPHFRPRNVGFYPRIREVGLGPFTLLFRAIDCVASENRLHVSILAIDDGSIQPFGAGLDGSAEYKAVKDLGVPELGRNVGHQRAIAVGLSYILAAQRYWRTGSRAESFIVLPIPDGGSTVTSACQTS